MDACFRRDENISIEIKFGFGGKKRAFIISFVLYAKIDERKTFTYNGKKTCNQKCLFSHRLMKT